MIYCRFVELFVANEQKRLTLAPCLPFSSNNYGIRCSVSQKTLKTFFFFLGYIFINRNQLDSGCVYFPSAQCSVTSWFIWIDFLVELCTRARLSWLHWTYKVFQYEMRQTWIFCIFKMHLYFFDVDTVHWDIVAQGLNGQVALSHRNQ